ncbi:beta strand repeat-containing protein [Croceitalea marina]|uniref:Beta strand repeat-containing protein n=1 Tax=Croceitalea marina TaxID=1775166 RepID=A0ABW5MWA5_9FLAO
MKKYFLSVMLGIFAMSFLQSQIKIGNNPQNIDASSVLELESNSRVLVITRVSAAQMNSITPLQGALVYNTDEACVFYFDGVAWLNLCEEGIFNTNFEVVGEELVLTDSQGDTVSVPLSDLGVVTFSADPVFNPVDNDNTIVITETGDNVNIEVGEITGFNIVDSSINGFLDIQDGSIVSSKLQDDSVDRSKIAANVAGIGLTQAPDGSLDVDVTEFSGEGVLSSPANTLTISGDPANALFNSVGLDVADNAITQIKMAENAIGTAEIINDAVTTDKILDASITNGKLDKPTIPISGFAPAAANVDFGNNRLLNVVDPVDITDVANKNYVDNAVGGLSNLADGTIYIGDAGNQAQEIAISGDATMDNAGVLTIEPDAVGTTEIIDANITNSKLDKVNIPLSGFGDAAADVALGGFQLKNVAEPTDAQDAATKNYVDNSIASSNALANTNIFVGSATGVATGVAMSGDATINNAGVLTIEPNAIETNEIADNAVTSAKINDGEIIDADVSGAAAIAGTKINPDFGTQNIATTGTVTVGASTITAAAGTNGQILTNDGAGNATWQNPAPLAVATTTALDGDGLAATPLDLADNAVTTAKLADGTAAGEILQWNGTNWVLVDDSALAITETDGIIGNEVTDATAGGSLVRSGTGATATPFTLDVADGGIGTTELAADAVDNTKVANNAINTENITDGQVQTDDIADANVTSAKLADGTAAGEILQWNGTNWVLVDDSALVITEVDGVIGNEVTDATTGGSLIRSGTGATATPFTLDVADGGIGTTELAADAVDNTKVADNAIRTENIVDGQVQTTDIGADAIDNTKIADDAVQVENILNGNANQVLVTNAAGTDVEWTDRSNVTTAGTAAGSIFFAAPTTFEPTEDNTQLFWDDTNNVLGIGTNTPDTSGNIRIQVNGSTRSGGFITSDGSANAPSYRFNSDPNTGMFWGGAADELGFSVGGIEALRIRDEGTTDSELVVNGSLELTEQLLDETGATGNAGDILTATATGTEWKEPAVVAMGKANGANSISVNGATIGGGAGINTVTLSTARPDDNYIIQLSVVGDNRIYITSQNPGNFTVEIRSNATGLLVVADWHFTILDF